MSEQCPRDVDNSIRSDGGSPVNSGRDSSRELAYKTVECWRCGEDRYIYESCMKCGGSCKPVKKRKQQEGVVE